ncbi:MAG: hypothetical protein IT256_09450 [Chitinophagaceae bacterium]|nr:hypothetical protein [Chitinophagaceae bacterium]
MKNKSVKSFLFVLGVSATIFATPSCNKGTTDGTEQKVSVMNGNMNFEIPVQLGSGDNDSMVSFYYKMNMDSFVKSYGSQYDTSSIRAVNLLSCSLVMTNGDTLSNVRNFHTANIGITSGTNRNIYRIAAFTNIVDTNAYSINIPRSYDPNLVSYFKADSVRYRLYGNVRRATKKPIKCTANLSFEMKLLK